MSVSTHLERAESALRRALINALAEGEDHLLTDLYENLQSVMDLNKKAKNVIRFTDNTENYYYNKDNNLSFDLTEPDLSGIDFSFESGKYNSSFGQFDYKINGTYLMKYETTQGGTSIERAGRFNHDIDGYSLPEYKVNLFALMEKNLNKYTFNARYVSGYDNHKRLLSRAISVGGYTNKVDSSLMYDLGYQRSFKTKNLDYN